jgi:hypothetical protein
MYWKRLRVEWIEGRKNGIKGSGGFVFCGISHKKGVEKQNS